MARSPRIAALLLVPVLALGAAACGVEAGEEGSSLVVDASTATSAPAPEGAPSTTAPDDDTTTTTTTADEPADDPADPMGDGEQAMTDAYVAMGFTEEEASCLADQITSAGTDFDPADATAMMDMLNQCDISMSRMMDVTEGLGGGDPEETMRESLKAGFIATGLSEEEASCVADAFVEEFGTDAASASDPSVLMGLFGDCGVDPSSIGN